MKTIYCLTFHSSYNYGSALQTYALKNYILNNFNVDYKLINLRTQKQKDLYKTIYDYSSYKSIYSRFFTMGYKNQVQKKKSIFESFFNSNFDLTEPIERIVDFDTSLFNKKTLLMCGSDQIWNIKAKDFDWSYFLDFTKGYKKFSFACSMGPKVISIIESEEKRIKNALSDFSYISVRDENTKLAIEKMGFNSQIVCDPTILLNKNSWEMVMRKPNHDLRSKQYILFYDLKRDKLNWKIAQSISKALKMPILITSVPYPRTISMSLGMKKRFDVGPSEFLYYLSHASLVLSSSYHGCIFSCIFEKPFYAVNCQNDERIGSFLNNISLTNRMISKVVKIDDLKDCFTINFERKRKYFEEAEADSKKYLEKILDE